jgi:hypothetical protein
MAEEWHQETGQHQENDRVCLERGDDRGPEGESARENVNSR